jgi:hypothetical protein
LGGFAARPSNRREGRQKTPPPTPENPTHIRIRASASSPKKVSAFFVSLCFQFVLVRICYLKYISKRFSGQERFENTDSFQFSKNRQSPGTFSGWIFFLSFFLSIFWLRWLSASFYCALGRFSIKETTKRDCPELAKT